MSRILLALFSNLIVVMSCNDRKPYVEEVYENPELISCIRIAKSNKALSLYDVDGHLFVSLHNRIIKKSDTLTLKLTDAQIASFNKIVKQQLNPNAYITADDNKKKHEVTFTIMKDGSNEMTGNYQSENFTDISSELGNLMTVIYENQRIKNFMDDEKVY